MPILFMGLLALAVFIAIVVLCCAAIYAEHRGPRADSQSAAAAPPPESRPKAHAARAGM